MSPRSQRTGGNNPALIGQQITGIKQAFSVSTLAHAKKNKIGANATERGRRHQPPVKKIYSHFLEYRAVPHRVTVNSGYFIIGRTQRRWACRAFSTRKQGHNSQLLQNCALQNPESKILRSTLQRGPGRSSGSAPFRLRPETTRSQGFSLKHRGKAGQFPCMFKPRTSNHAAASASCPPRR